MESDERNADRIAGICAIAAGTAWLVWAAANLASHGALERTGEGSIPRLLSAGRLLTMLWNLLLIPAALRLDRKLSRSRPAVMPIVTAAGILSLVFWAFGGLTGITPDLEIAYLTLAAVWLISLGVLLRRGEPKLATLTLVTGAFTALDAAFSLYGPVPFFIYVLASPKLPLCAVWSIVLGTSFLRGTAAPVAGRVAGATP